MLRVRQRREQQALRKTTKQQARGKWRGILSELVGSQAISTKHGPCPICGGIDRYRFDNKQNNGDWFCNVCGVGDGFRLVQEALGISFAEAARMIDRVINNHEPEPFVEVIDIAKRRDGLNKLWGAAQSPEIVIEYLKSRAIPPEIIAQASDLRGIPRLFDKTDGSYAPGMLAMVRLGPEGKPVSLHRTFIGENKKKKLMPPLENTVGGYIRLGVPYGTLVLAEGIETALSGWWLTGFPAWACISANNLELFDAVPKDVTKVIICADNDRSFAGQAAAFKCAFRLRNRRSLDVEVWMPRSQGLDMNDIITVGGPMIEKWHS